MKRKLEKLFRLYFPKRLNNKDTYINTLKKLSGIEIGGPSLFFSNKGLLPIYSKIKNLDGCNFSDNTVWEGQLNAGNTYKYLKDKPAGVQYITEGNDLKPIHDSTYDFLLSCHNLEHFANPLKALYEWKRIVRNNGYLLLVLPNKEKTFDRNRPVTTFEHLVEDYQNEMPETDTTHFEEVIALHDVDMDAGIASKQALAERTYKNIENRCVHHHVFDAALVKEMLEKTGFEIIAFDLIQINIIALVKIAK